MKKKTLKSVYYVIYESHLCYASLFRAQNTNSVKRLHFLQKKSLGTMFFQSPYSHSGSLFNNSKILLKSSFKSQSYDACGKFRYIKILLYQTIIAWYHLQSCLQDCILQQLITYQLKRY